MLWCFLRTAFLASVISHTILENTTPPKTNDNIDTSYDDLSEQNTFKEYFKKYDPVTVNEEIKKQLKEEGRNVSSAEFFNMCFEKIDPIDDLLKLKVQNGKATVLPQPDGRRKWVPPRGLTIIDNDLFSLRPRLFELMKQAIYQTRNKMILMQLMREKYRTHSVYKMGYLTAKTDTACKVFARVAKFAYDGCSISRGFTWHRYNLHDTQVSLERLLHLWFRVDLLVDLIIKNDMSLYRLFEEHHDKRAERWQFVD